MAIDPPPFKVEIIDNVPPGLAKLDTLIKENLEKIAGAMGLTYDQYVEQHEDVEFSYARERVRQFDAEFRQHRALVQASVHQMTLNAMFAIMIQSECPNIDRLRWSNDPRQRKRGQRLARQWRMLHPVPKFVGGTVTGRYLDPRRGPEMQVLHPSAEAVLSRKDPRVYIIVDEIDAYTDDPYQEFSLALKKQDYEKYQDGRKLAMHEALGMGYSPKEEDK